MKKEQAFDLGDGSPVASRAPAYFDTNGVLRDSQSGALLAADWEGVAERLEKGPPSYWYIGREGRERTFFVMSASSWPRAIYESKVIRALSLDIGDLLSGFDLSALRLRGMNTVGSVTGSDPKRFYESAYARLEPLYPTTSTLWETGHVGPDRIALAKGLAGYADDQERMLRQLSNEPTGHAAIVCPEAVSLLERERP